MSGSTTFCPSCGAEYLSGVTECADCHVSLTAAAGATAGADEGDEVVYDLADWGVDERMQLERLLTGEGVTHRWEVGSDLVVVEADADAVERLLDEIEGTGDVHPLPATEDEEDDGNDEANYAVMSDLFVSADRLQKDPSDPASAGEFFVASDAVAATPAPFGIDRLEWQQVQELASSLAGALESDVDDDVIARDAGALRSILARYV
jgi:hypothetical protein